MLQTNFKLDWEENSSMTPFKIDLENRIDFDEDFSDEENTPTPQRPQFDLIYSNQKGLSHSKVIIEEEPNELDAIIEEQLNLIDSKRDFLKDYKGGVSTGLMGISQIEKMQKNSERSIQHGTSPLPFLENDELGESLAQVGVRREWEIKAQVARHLFCMGNNLIIFV